MPKVKICIADDHDLFRDGLVQLINRQPDMEVVGVARDGLEMLTRVRELKPDLVFMDISMPISDGIESVSVIREFDPAVKIIMLTGLDSDEKMIDAIKAGANGYLLKNTNSEGFLRAVRGALARETTLPRHLAGRLIKEYTEALKERSHMPSGVSYDSPTLTSRETQVLKLIAGGASNQQIAEQLSISLFTTKSHVRNVLGKLGAKDRWQAVKIAQTLGLLRAAK